MNEMRSSMITARDVAELVGLSISTVGRALTNDPRISAETIAKVKKAADGLGYVRNLPAQMMRGGSSNLIGLLLPDVRNDFYSAIAQSLSESCDQHGFRVVLSITGDDRDAEHRHLRELAGARVAGTIIVPTQRPRRESITLLKELPHVQLLRRHPSVGGAWFGIDDEGAVNQAAEHLLTLGHREIAYVGGHGGLSTGAARETGVRRAYADAGLPTDHLQILHVKTTVSGGEEALQSLLGQPSPPTAVISGSVHVTQGFLSVLTARSISVPSSLSVVGFGDPFWSAWWGPGLTTIRPPVRSLAAMCGLWMIDAVRKERSLINASDDHGVVQSALIVRGSTAPPSKRPG
jgi:DNA-binding LacI/PurR family transcriptional regulator